MQVLLHDIFKPAELPSAIRLLATSRMLGLLLGPLVGGVMLLVLSPWLGLMVNALLYMPALLWLASAPYGPKYRTEPQAPTVAMRGFADIWTTIRVVSGDPILLSMIAVAGAASVFRRPRLSGADAGLRRSVGACRFKRRLQPVAGGQCRRSPRWRDYFGMARAAAAAAAHGFHPGDAVCAWRWAVLPSRRT